MDFLNLGYHIADATWFNEVKLLPPASCLVWDLTSLSIIELTTYWSHKDLNENTITGSKQEIIFTLNKLFKQAVENRVGDQERVGITLSGGLDSRLIFANIPFQEKNFAAITRGMKNAGDIKLAKQVANLREDCQHIIKDMDASNWLDGRINALITTSGQKNLFDMNAMSSLPIHKTYFDINLDGAGGDGIFTGGHLKYENKKNLETAFRKNYYKNIFDNEKESLDRFVDYYKTINSDQHFYIHERIRRFVVFGSILGHDYGIITRFPFLDHQLQDYFYQLDKKHNANDLYYKMLVKYYPDYFIKIDSLTSGTKLYGSITLNFIAKFKSRIQEKMGFKKYLRSYHSYPKWIVEENRALLDDYILSKDLYLYDFISYSDTRRVVEFFLETGKMASLISRLISLSVFFENYKKVLNSK